MGTQSSTTVNQPWLGAIPALQAGQDALSGYSDWMTGPGGQQGALAYGSGILNGTGTPMAGIPQYQAPYNPLLNYITGGMGAAASQMGDQATNTYGRANTYGNISDTNYGKYLDPAAQWNQDLMNGNWDKLGVVGQAYKAAMEALDRISSGSGSGGSIYGGGGGPGGGVIDPNMFQIDQSKIDAAIAAAARPVYNQLNNVTMPGLTSQAIKAGRYGSNAAAAQGNLANTAATNAVMDQGGKLGYQAMLDNQKAMLDAAIASAANQTSSGNAAMAANASMHNADVNAAINAAQSLMTMGSDLTKRQDTLANTSYGRYMDTQKLGDQELLTSSNIYGGMYPIGNGYKSDMQTQNDTMQGNFERGLYTPLDYTGKYMNVANTGSGNTSQTTVPTYNPSGMQNTAAIIASLSAMGLI